MKLKYSSVGLAFLLILVTQSFSYAQQAKEVARIPFENHNGTIILTVKLNDFSRPLRLLFDTGADGMAVGQPLADSIGLKVARVQKASVVGGSMDISVSTGNTVHMGSFDFKEQSIAIFKEMHKEGTDGIIGNTLARHYIVKVDYDRKEMILYNFGDLEEKGGIAIPFSIPSGLFIIPGTLSITTDQPHTGNFVFDTGAAYNLICFRPFVKQHKLLVSGFKADSHGSTTSMGMSTPTFAGKAAAFSFAGMQPIKDMSVTLMAGGGQSESWNPGFDGSIGVGLISNYNFTINMQKKEIYIIPNKNNKK
ncbi:retropepsin-like aspartic protease [Pedobacter frigoris]|uniref:retropepsin-like aspartic protease n=1 Tax=Pedobacter frigoris TaxID=2571272 RepID=UPI0029319CA5|nr:retropepsin-like aspartic protease [Pedobacter frigoris]